MVVPLLKSTVYGAVWYQGEADAGHAGGCYDGYNCTFPAMIDDWRAKWGQETGGLTDPQFPFGFVQLNGNGNGPTYNHPKDPGADFSSMFGFAGLRWSQTAGYGYAPNPRMPRTFMAVILDTPNPTGGVHSAFKRPAGARLARAGLSVAYGVDVETISPRVDTVSLVGRGAGAPRNVMVKLTSLGSSGGVELHNTTGFEVLSDGYWVSVPITSHTSNSVMMGPVPANSSRVRYAWYGNACGLGLFQCAVYTKVKPLGKLDGELDFLPLAPFVMDL